MGFIQLGLQCFRNVSEVLKLSQQMPVIIIFEAANLMGPSIAGVLLDINIRLCLPIFMIIMSLIYLVI